MKHELEVFFAFLKKLLPKMKKSSVLFLALLALANLPFGPLDAWGKEAELFILHTNNVTGHLFPCPT